MNLQIRVLSGPNQGDIFPLADGKPLTVGRSRESQIHLADPSVSRSHCQIELIGSSVVVRDLESRSGTLVDGKRITEQKLNTLQTVGIGGTRLILESAEDDTEATIPPIAYPITSETPTAPTKAVAAKAAAAPKVPTKAVAAKAAPDAAAPTKAVVTKAVADVAAPKTPALPAERLHELSGQKLSHFQIGALLAKGQSGVVFEATDLDHNRKVALKVLWPEFTLNEQEVQRFIRAMKTMLPINHVNLVRIYGAGRSAPYCWLAMELVEGHSLAAVAERMPSGGKIAWKNVLRIGIYIARGLEYAHKQSILHRNVTPRNILIGRRPDICKLADLMLAKAMDGPMAEHVTTSGQLLGDVTCMSPERTTGDPSNMDERSDIYSLGASMYAAVCGQPPFVTKSPIQALIKIRQEQPAPPRSLQPNMPEQFEQIITKMLAKRPEQRYATATELRHVLEDLADANGVDI